jgi:purine nucleoside permease
MYDRHKLHTHFTDVFARFYVDDILCGEILYNDYPDSWPIGLYLIPELGIKNDSQQNYIYWQLILPMIHADLIYVGGGT